MVLKVFTDDLQILLSLLSPPVALLARGMGYFLLLGNTSSNTHTSSVRLFIV